MGGNVSRPRTAEDFATIRARLDEPITVTVYSMLYAAHAARCSAPLAALVRVCPVSTGGRAGARLLRSIPGSRAGSRWWGPLDSARRRRVGRHGEKRRKIGDQCAQWRHRRQLIILARQLRPSARPRPVFGTPHQPRDQRIKSDLTRRRHQMRLVHHHRAKAPLEQMARPAEASVDGPGVAPVRFGKGRSQPVHVRGRRDQADVIGHQAIGPNCCAGAPRRSAGERSDNRRLRKTQARAGYRAG